MVFIMQTHKITQSVVQQKIALDSYLSMLLDEIPTEPALEQKTVKPVVTPTLKKQSVKTIVEKKQPIKVVKIKPAIKSKSQEKPKEQVKQALSIMPDWSQHEFQALFFKVDKLTLAAPLTELLRTLKADKKPTKIPNQPSWFIGLLETNGQRIGLLDTGQLVFGKAIGQQRNLETHPFKSILITGDGKWGLACDEILTIGQLKPDKVRWRIVRENRPWLIGTVIDELTAIIDVTKLVPHRKTK